MAKIKKEVKSDKPKLKKTPIKKVQKPTQAKKSKELKSKIKTSVEKTALVKKELNFDQINVDVNQLQKGIEALLEYNKRYKTKDLFAHQQQILLQITCIRIPTCANRKIRIALKYPLMSDDSEICLIVPDLKRGRKVDHEPTIEHYEDLLRSKKVNCVKRIIPIRQIRVEYDQFELKRRLCGYYDAFLVDGRISGHVLHLLGKIFTEKKKQPIPIQLTANNLNDKIGKAISKTELEIQSKGDSCFVQIGHTEMTPEQINDNLQVVIKALVKKYPGSWPNIRSLHVKTDKSIAIPVYYTMKNTNEVKPPVVKPPKPFEKITDELTTRRHDVTVFPDGTVVLNSPNKSPKQKKLKKKKPAIKKQKKPKRKKEKVANVKKENVKIDKQ